MEYAVLLVEDNDISRELYRDALRAEGYRVTDVGDGESALEVIRTGDIDVLLTDVVLPGMSGIELLEQARSIQPKLRAVVMTGYGTDDTIIAALKHQSCDFLTKPVTFDDLRDAVRAAAEASLERHVEVLSAKPDWIEVRVPCDLRAADPLQRLLSRLQTNLLPETSEAIASVFRELLINAIEHGGKFDPAKYIEVKCIRLNKAILYSIKDPGEGFDLASVDHAAVSNPDDEPFRHMQVRKEMGLRPGGFGILLATQVVDELVYNEKHNEVLFVKYLDRDASE